jgi:hypothetical protein
MISSFKQSICPPDGFFVFMGLFIDGKYSI